MDKKNSFSYDIAIKRLEEILGKLEKGNNTLDEDLKLYEEGIKLCDLCRCELDDAELKIKQYNGG